MSTYGYLAHHGVKGMKWGVRRYQNEDGSLTEAGKKRYYNPDGSLTNKGVKEIPNENYSDEQQKRDESIYGQKGVKRINAELNRGNMISGARSLEAQRVEKKEKTKKTAKKVAKVGAAATGTVLATSATLYATNPAFRNAVNKGVSKVKQAIDDFNYRRKNTPKDTYEAFFGKQ